MVKTISCVFRSLGGNYSETRKGEMSFIDYASSHTSPSVCAYEPHWVKVLHFNSACLVSPSSDRIPRQLHDSSYDVSIYLVDFKKTGYKMTVR